MYVCIEMLEVVEDREMWRPNLQLLPRQPPRKTEDRQRVCLRIGIVNILSVSG